MPDCVPDCVAADRRVAEESGDGEGLAVGVADALGEEVDESDVLGSGEDVAVSSGVGVALDDGAPVALGVGVGSSVTVAVGCGVVASEESEATRPSIVPPVIASSSFAIVM